MSFIFKTFVVVIGSVDDGEHGADPCIRAALRCRGHAVENGGRTGVELRSGSAESAGLLDARGQFLHKVVHRASSLISRAIFDVAWITVVWSRPPNSLPIFGSDESVSSRERYIATWRG